MASFSNKSCYSSLLLSSSSCTSLFFHFQWYLLCHCTCTWILPHCIAPSDEWFIGWDNQMIISAAKNLASFRWPTLDSSEQVILHFLIDSSSCRQRIPYKPPGLRKVRSLRWPLFEYETFINLTCMEFGARSRWVQTLILQILGQTILSGLGRGTTMCKTESQFSWHSKPWSKKQWALWLS